MLSSKDKAREDMDFRKPNVLFPKMPCGSVIRFGKGPTNQSVATLTFSRMMRLLGFSRIWRVFGISVGCG
jgi:hypothetical protein